MKTPKNRVIEFTLMVLIKNEYGFLFITLCVFESFPAPWFFEGKLYC